MSQTGPGGVYRESRAIGFGTIVAAIVAVGVVLLLVWLLAFGGLGLVAGPYGSGDAEAKPVAPATTQPAAGQAPVGGASGGTPARP